MFYVVERSIVILKPKTPFLEWINSNLMTDDKNLLDLESIRVDCNSYLIPEVEEIEDGIKYVDDAYERLFQLELSSWSEDENLWPKGLTLKMFWEWFDVEILPTLIDLSDDDNEDDDTQTITQYDKSWVDTIH